MGDLAEENAHAMPMENSASCLLDEEDVGCHVYVQSFDGPIFFGFTSYFTQVISKLPEVKMVVFRMEKVPCIDQSGMYALEDAVLELEKRGIEIF